MLPGEKILDEPGKIETYPGLREYIDMLFVELESSLCNRDHLPLSWAGQSRGREVGNLSGED